MAKKFAAILFDCDGVLVDSEAITLGVLRDMLSERGWELSLAECTEFFLGRLVRDNSALIEARTGQAVTPEWTAEFLDRRDAALSASLQPIAGIHSALARIHAVYGADLACASGADRRKIELQLHKVDLMRYFAGRCFSGFEMPKSKPAPDVYLAAARQLGHLPELCAVIEDSAAGVKAGLASGAKVFAFIDAESHQVEVMGGAAALTAAHRALGAHQVFYHMSALPALLGID